MRLSGLITQMCARGSRAAIVLLATFAASPALTGNAFANNPSHTEYSLSVVEGESTLPEEIVAHVSANVSPSAQVVLTISRSGMIIYRSPIGEGNAWLSQVPQVGDVVAMELPARHVVVGSFTYDGLPSLDPTVCTGSENFSGQRSGAMEVSGGYYTLVQVTDPYGNVRIHHAASGQAQVTTQVGQSFAGNFLTPLALGQTVWASESVTSQLEGGATFTYQSETQRPVGACPVPPAPPPPPPPPPALLGSVFKFARVTLTKLLRSGFSDRVTINQPGTVTQDLYLQGGSVPATAASTTHKRHKRKPPALLLARGSAQAKSAGTVSVSLKLTSQGRRKLNHVHSVKAVLITTLHSSSGAKLNLGPRTVTLHR